MTLRTITLSTLLIAAPMLNAQQQPANPFLELMQRASAHAAAHHTQHKPALSPIDVTILNGMVPVTDLHQLGIEIAPWTTNDPARIHAVIKAGVDSIISDRPDLVQAALIEERGLPRSRRQPEKLQSSGPSRRPRPSPGKHSPCLRIGP